MDQDVLDARAKLAARFGKAQVGGKGMYLLFNFTYNSTFAVYFTFRHIQSTLLSLSI